MTEMRKISPSELRKFHEERSKGAVYFVKAKIKHPPLYSGIITGPSMFVEEFRTEIPIFALKDNFLSDIKRGDIGSLIDAEFENRKIQYLKINWRKAIQIYYSGPVQLSEKRYVTLERMFDIIQGKLKK
ncbi:hypothetical protein HY450_02835 [Candidatus Pacearchaeota archaeon]|nr:hypothetical protein [Candidatus Pacearchaeota archaeon]